MVALQRLQETATTWAHVRALNIVLKRLKAFPVSITYRKLGPDTSFLVFTAAAFKKEEETGHALEGTLVVRVATETNKTTLVMRANVDQNCHVIDFISKRVRNRAIFTLLCL